MPDLMAARRPAVFVARYWLSQKLFKVGLAVEPDHRTIHSDDGRTLTFRVVPARWLA